MATTWESEIYLDLSDTLHEILSDGSCRACGEWVCFNDCGYVGRDIDPDTGWCEDCAAYA